MAQPEGSIVLTGANGGLGIGFVSELLKSPHAISYRAIYTVRNVKTAQSLQAALKNAPATHKHEISALDLTTIASVRAWADTINSRVADGSLPPIRALILNAAFQDETKQVFTSDGLDANFEINYLANFLLILLLLQSIDKTHGRIVFVSSCAHNPKHLISSWAYPGKLPKTLFTDVEDMAKGVYEFKKGDEAPAGFRLYGRSKLLMVMLMFVTPVLAILLPSYFPPQMH
jgi:NAD(P)-dependent dehydrogenase (short-subunit alcohol dehydrogenase family)